MFIFTSFTNRPTLAAPKASESNFVSKMKASGRNIVVFYGSQTGTAEEFAGRLAKEAARYGMKALVADPEECQMVCCLIDLPVDINININQYHVSNTFQEDITKLSEIENSLAVFCVATYGEGEPTDNAQAFYDWLQTGDADLSGVNFSVRKIAWPKYKKKQDFIFKGKNANYYLMADFWTWQQNIRTF